MILNSRENIYCQKNDQIGVKSDQYSPDHSNICQIHREAHWKNCSKSKPTEPKKRTEKSSGQLKLRVQHILNQGNTSTSIVEKLSDEIRKSKSY